MSLTIDEIIECRTDLLTFSKTMYAAMNNSEFIDNWHHQEICTALEKVFIGQTRRLIITVPPRHSKTLLAVLNFIAWSMGNIPDCEFIHSSYSKRLAAENTSNARAIMEHETYAEIFGTPEFRKDTHAKDHYKTVQGGVVYASGSEGTLTGYGAGKMRHKFGGAIILDDVLKAGDGNSDIMRQNIIDWFSTTIESRTNSKETPIIVIGQRLHEEDLPGFLLVGGNNEEWTHLDLPALDKNNIALWPYKLDYDDLMRLEKSNPYVFAGQYMQRPSPAGGGLFKDEYWKYYDVLPTDIDLMRIYGDTAQKTAEHNDYSVFQMWARSQSMGLFLIDQCRGKWEAPELEQQLVQFWNKHRPGQFKRMGAQVVKIEDKSSGSSLIQSIQRQYMIPVEPIQRNKDKIFRAMGVVKYFSSGYMHLPKNAEWVYDYISEFSKFTPLMNHKHDDQIDPTMDAVEDLLVFDTMLYTDNTI